MFDAPVEKGSQRKNERSHDANLAKFWIAQTSIYRVKDSIEDQQKRDHKPTSIDVARTGVNHSLHDAAPVSPARHTGVAKFVRSRSGRRGLGARICRHPFLLGE